jgi:RHS repeat-associated protein
MLSVDGGGTATFVNDAEGRRVQKTSGGQSRDYIFDVGGNVVAETVGGLWRTGYVYLGGSLLAQYRNGTTYFAHRDHLGSIRMLTDPTKANFDSVDFMPFGEQLAGDSGSSHKFTGKERDSESNLDFFGARYYGGNMGRFMNPDPLYIEMHRLADPQQLNLYTYGRNNPLSITDPTGLDITAAEHAVPTT